MATRRQAPGRDLMGNLTVFPPTSILQMLNLSEATGELKLTSGRNAAHVFFEGGRIAYAGIKKRSLKLGEYLVSQGVVSKSALDDALRQKNKLKRLGDCLIETGAVSREALSDAVQTQIREVIFEVLRWQDGRFVFASGKKPENEDILIDVPLDHLMLEGLIRMDEESEPTD